MVKYDSYKDSGVEWVGDIPNEWVKTKIKFTTNIVGRIGYRGYTVNDVVSEGEGVISLSPSNITKDYKILLKNSTYISFEKYEESPEIKVYPNDLILVKTSSVGKMTFIPENVPQLTLNPQLVVLKNISCNSKHLYYFLLSPFFQNNLEINKGGGVIPTISQEKINGFDLVLPPLKEQQQIVSFLDTKTTLIDSLIEKTQKKIELLKEKRTSLINHTVTKGLNPNVEMKDNDVEWIGEIPSHWEIGKLYQYSNLLSGSTPSRVVPEYWNNGNIPWMSSGEINKRIIDKIDGRITELGHEKSNTPMLPIGTVMMGLNGQGKTKGTVGILEVESTCNQSLCGMIFNKNSQPKYQFYFLDSQYNHLRGLVGDGKREGISVSFLGRYPLVVPPLKEQQQIVEYLDEQTNIIDTTITKEQKRVKLLKEYRQSLISEVVTGKIKVTNE